MAETYKTVNIVVNGQKTKETVRMEIGCSFENNGNIYRMNNDGLLSVFDKKAQKWMAKDEITMTGYQFDTFKAVANNTKEKINGKVSNDIIFSKSDVDFALKDLYSKGKLTADLGEFLRGGYAASNVTGMKNNNAFSALISNGNAKTSGTLVFKYGSAADAVTISEHVNGKPAAPAQTPDSASQTKPATPAKPAAATTPVKPAEIKKEETKPAEVKKKDKAKGKEKVHHKDRSKSTPLPRLFVLRKKMHVSRLGLKNEKELDKYIAKAAKETGYSEYFITHIICLENYEKKPRNIGDGAITVGFGHTNLKDPKVTMKTEVTPDKAFNWLIQDIKDFEKKVKTIKLRAEDQKEGRKTLGDCWDEMPLSLREATIDVAFNRDYRKLETAPEYESFRANIAQGEENLPAAAVRLRQDFSKYTFEQKLNNKFTTGLMSRNCYRFLLAIRDFDDEYRKIAKQKFDNDQQYFSQTKALLYKKDKIVDRDLLQKAWDAM